MSNNNTYLTNIPQQVEEYGFCKTLAVRREVIHIKHIMTEVFVRKTIDIQKYLDMVDMSLFDYMEYMTNRLRRVHYFSREYRNDVNEIVKSDRDNFFPTLKLYEGLKNCIVLDFDGVVTKKYFNENLYPLCIDRCNNIQICSANPTITEDWFMSRNLKAPSKINSMKGKKQKLIRLLEIQKRHDYMFYVDNEEIYLEFAWLFGIQTYIFANNKISYFSLNSK